MDALEAVEALARRARAETPPQTNVRMATVLSAHRPEQRLVPLAWSAGLSAGAACVVMAPWRCTRINPPRPIRSCRSFRRRRCNCHERTYSTNFQCRADSAMPLLPGGEDDRGWR